MARSLHITDIQYACEVASINLKGRIVMRLTIILASLILGFSAAPVAAQTYVEVLRDRFMTAGLYSPGAQFAAMTFNVADVGTLKPQPLVGNGPAAADARNYLSFQGLPAVHAEAALAAAAPGVAAAYPANFGGTAVSQVTVFTLLQPCSTCAGALATLPVANNWTATLGFFEEYPNQTEASALVSMTALSTGGWQVVWIPATGPQPMFQSALYSCVLAEPVVCDACVNRPAAIRRFVNAGMSQIQTRNAAAWRNYADANIDKINHDLVVLVFQVCATWNAERPIGPPI